MYLFAQNSYGMNEKLSSKMSYLKWKMECKEWEYVKSHMGTVLKLWWVYDYLLYTNYGINKNKALRVALKVQVVDSNINEMQVIKK